MLQNPKTLLIQRFLKRLPTSLEKKCTIENNDSEFALVSCLSSFLSFPLLSASSLRAGELKREERGKAASPHSRLLQQNRDVTFLA